MLPEGCMVSVGHTNQRLSDIKCKLERDYLEAAGITGFYNPGRDVLPTCIHI
jgi:hypothetical protein